MRSCFNSQSMERLIIVILITATGAQDNQLKGPENTLSIVGFSVTLKCSSQARNCSKFEWWKSGSYSSNWMTVFKESSGILTPFRDRYSVDNASGCDLVIKNVQLTDAGRFTCSTVISGNTPLKSANLIVLKTVPNCTTNASKDDTLKGDGVRLSCEVKYNATSKASIIWKGVANAPDAVENGSTISRSYSFAASAPEVPPYICETSFPADTTIKRIATNIPNTSCVTTVIKVLYSVREVTLSPPYASHRPGSVITCEANGHPPPTFKWQQSENAGGWVDIQNVSQFVRSDVSSHQYRCVAMNVVKGISYKSTSSEFQINNTISDELTSTPVGSSVEADRPSFGVGIGIGLLTAIALAAVAFVILIKLGYIEFHRRPGNNPRDGSVQHTEQEMMHPSTHGTGDPQDSTYASLGENRDANVYQSIEKSQKSKEKKKSRP